ncbi:SDR family oxidoreductase [Planotetraspora sp. A-T 1434]|uniref:SDR family NAD(P)-dependent oxidoreductase n=1 Tax=Planotetraspora sp. A-T 1434 TaxID=2979219 RepID=UPI0021C17269|nr:SDR family oxidoreductase [Planotetraspora sp. A-T 1434]MCT9931480.1 SDR family oxidoreductase [Planotetraspora sp. A-T 1434]
MSTTVGTALITGASSGIGAVYADRLARRGHDLILVARNRERLDAVAKRITAQTGRTVEVLTADLGLADDVRRVEQVLRSRADISVLVNNAGFGAVAPLVASDVDAMESMITLNVTALTRLTYAFAPAAASRGGGTMINIGSIVAVVPELLNGVYGASKAYVLALSQSLRHELGEKGLRVQVVLPGATATDFWEIAGNPVENLPQAWVMTADDMVDAALTGLDDGEFVTIPALPDVELWDAYQAARQALSGNLSGSRPAERYRRTSATH